MDNLPISNLHRQTILLNVWVNLFLITLLITSKSFSTSEIARSAIGIMASIYVLGISNIGVMYLANRQYIKYVYINNWLRYAISFAVSGACFALLVFLLYILGLGEVTIIVEKNKYEKE